MPILRATRLWSRRTWAVFRIVAVAALVVVILWQLVGVIFHASDHHTQNPTVAVG